MVIQITLRTKLSRLDSSHVALIDQDYITPSIKKAPANPDADEVRTCECRALEMNAVLWTWSPLRLQI